MGEVRPGEDRLGPGAGGPARRGRGGGGRRFGWRRDRGWAAPATTVITVKMSDVENHEADEQLGTSARLEQVTPEAEGHRGNAEHTKGTNPSRTRPSSTSAEPAYPQPPQQTGPPCEPDHERHESQQSRYRPEDPGSPRIDRGHPGCRRRRCRRPWFRRALAPSRRRPGSVSSRRARVPASHASDQ